MKTTQKTALYSCGIQQGDNQPMPASKRAVEHGLPDGWSVVAEIADGMFELQAPATAGEQTEVRRPGGWTLSLERVS